MIRHKFNHVTLVPGNLPLEAGGSVHVSVSREYAEAAPAEPSGEVVYTRDTIDAQVSSPEVVAAAREFLATLARHYSSSMAVPVKMTGRELVVAEPAPAEPIAPAR